MSIYPDSTEKPSEDRLVSSESVAESDATIKQNDNLDSVDVFFL